ncbi:hypothetical protein LguiB_015436 [Lonicera macranthoides]
MPSEYSELVKNVAKNARNSLIFEEVELLPSSVAAFAYRLISYCVGSSPISSLSTLVLKMSIVDVVAKKIVVPSAFVAEGFAIKEACWLAAAKKLCNVAICCDSKSVISLAYSDLDPPREVKVMMASEDLKTSEIAVLSIVNLAKEAKIAGEGVEVPSLLALLSICKSLIAGGVSVHTLFSFVYLFSIKSFVKLCLFCSSFD